MSTFSDNRIDGQTIGLNCLVFPHICVYHVFNGRTINRIQNGHLGKANSIIMGRHFNKCRCFRSASAPFTTSFFCLCWAAEKRVVNLNKPSQLVSGISIPHCPTNLVQHRPGFPIAQTQFFRKSKCRYTTFVSTYQIYCPEPEQKLCLGIMHYSTSSQRCLMSTLFELTQFTMENKIV